MNQECKITVEVRKKYNGVHPDIYERILGPDNTHDIEVKKEGQYVIITVRNLKLNGFSSVVEEIIKSLDLIDSL